VVLRKVLPALVILATLHGCGGGADAPSQDGSLQVALLTSGPVSDAGWYAGRTRVCMVIRDSLGARVSHQQTRTPAEFDEAFVELGSAGYDLVFAHGFEYQDAAIRASARFPEMTIVVSGGGRVAANVIPLIFRLEEGSYLAGMVAGGMTRTGTVGMVGGVAIPPAVGPSGPSRPGPGP
jgi:basic membrane protein A and related proteins